MPVIYTDNETGQRFRFKDGTSAAEAQAKITNYFANEQKRQQDEDEAFKAYVRENTGLGEAAWQSTKRGFSQLPILGKQFLGAGIGAFGGTETSRGLMESAAADQQRLAEENPKVFDSFAANPLGYATEAVFENVPNIAGVLGTGLAGVGVRAGIGALGRAGATELGEAALAAGAKTGARKAFERGAAAGSRHGRGRDVWRAHRQVRLRQGFTLDSSVLCADRGNGHRAWAGWRSCSMPNRSRT
jgi:hypothetical protein